jgi:hypothetical protein
MLLLLCASWNYVSQWFLRCFWCLWSMLPPNHLMFFDCAVQVPRPTNTAPPGELGARTVVTAVCRHAISTELSCIAESAGIPPAHSGRVAPRVVRLPVERMRLP